MKWISPALTAVFLFCYLLIPADPSAPLKEAPLSTVLLDREGRLMGAVLASDEQWRFPGGQNPLPDKYRTCLVQFEDRRFFHHPGIDLLSVVRAAGQNISSGSVVSGASTLSMQVVRLARMGQPRLYREKIRELFLALKLELLYPKNDILQIYAAHASFGGNIVGLQAASWRYFNRKPENLSWAEAALLAVLPNAPSLIHPGKNREALLKKRNRLLQTLKKRGVLNEEDYRLSLREDLPAEPHPFPRLADHLLFTLYNEKPGQLVHSSLDSRIQAESRLLLNAYSRELALAKIHNGAVLVTETSSGKVRAYVGNSDVEDLHAPRVDIIQSERSPGSLLKPFLYALSLESGLILPDELLKDVPLLIDGFSPDNFSRSHDGAVPASEALIRSLNIPFVSLLSRYDYRRFYDRMNLLGLSFSQGSDHYGLSLILGGSETSLWDLSALFSGMGRVLMKEEPAFFENTWKQNPGKRTIYRGKPLSPSSVWFTLEAMKNLNRPGADSFWERFGSGIPIAWKTGTSMGFRDAWAIGVTPEYTVSVWIGNADGEGRPGIFGVKAAAPLMFQLFRQLDTGGWFKKPYAGIAHREICVVSGLPASPYCPETEEREIPFTQTHTAPCPYHKLIHLDEEGRYQVTSENHDVETMKHKVFFLLPPVQEWYYSRSHTSYTMLPPEKESSGRISPMQFLYPLSSSSGVHIPRQLDSSPGKIVCEVAHRDRDAVLFWYIKSRDKGSEYLGETRHIHQMTVSEPPGGYVLTVVDREGNRISSRMEIE